MGRLASHRACRIGDTAMTEKVPNLQASVDRAVATIQAAQMDALELHHFIQFCAEKIHADALNAKAANA